MFIILQTAAAAACFGIQELVKRANFQRNVFIYTIVLGIFSISSSLLTLKFSFSRESKQAVRSGQKKPPKPQLQDFPDQILETNESGRSSFNHQQEQIVSAFVEKVANELPDNS